MTAREAIRYRIPIAVGLLLLFLPSVSPAHTFEAPDSVEANEDGYFSYEAVFTAGPGGAELLGVFFINEGNVQPDIDHGDYLCIHHYEEGETQVITSSGFLIVPASPGFITVRLLVCDDSEFDVQTVILPYTPTSVRRETWGKIKSLYR